jgi:transglutaminase-like putative cysteine protease
VTTTTRPSPPAATPRTSPGRPATAPRVDSEAFPLSTIALTALTLVAALSMGRLFGGVSHLGPVLVATLLAHGIAFECRRRRIPTIASVALGFGAVVVVTAWLVLPATTFYGIPLGRTWHVASRDVRDALVQFRDVVAPARATPGFVLASVLGVTLSALLSDWAAFRMQATFEAAIPSFTIFLFTALLGTTAGQTFAVAGFVAGLLAFIALHNAETLSRGTAWFSGRTKATVTSSLSRAGTLVVVAVLAAVIVGPNLPGAGSAPVLDWRKKTTTGAGGSNRVTVSPLVDIRARLVNQANIEVFDVATSSRAYWRLTSLDVFDGSIWSSNGVYQPVKKKLSVVSPNSDGATRVTQRYSVLALNSTWLPAAYEPVHVSGLAGVGYDPQSGSLLPDAATSDGLTYTVESDVSAPQLTPALLEAAGAGAVPKAISRRYLPLPAIPSSVVAEAQRVAGTGSAYSKARRLEDYFRSGRFTYDLTVPAGHDDRAMERFLFRTRRGFCEQFAGTFAVMARAVGLPTRVAVGFTPGALGADGKLHVFSLNAHAWPEVWMGSAGWVTFEPTPGRGVPGGEPYTGVPEAQAASEAPTTATTAAAAPTTAPDRAPRATTTVAPRGSAVTIRRTASRSRLPWVAAGIGVLGLLWLLVVPTLHRVRRTRRMRLAHTPGERVVASFGDAVATMGRLGAGRRADETPVEWARRAGRAAALPRELARDLGVLADDVSAAWFSSGQVADEAEARSRATTTALEAHMVGRTTRRQRWAWALDPRPLLRPPGPSDAQPSDATARRATRAA